jgi:hypothetical protein
MFSTIEVLEVPLWLFEILPRKLMLLLLGFIEAGLVFLSVDAQKSLPTVRRPTAGASTAASSSATASPVFAARKLVLDACV